MLLYETKRHNLHALRFLSNWLFVLRESTACVVAGVLLGVRLWTNIFVWVGKEMTEERSRGHELFKNYLGCTLDGDAIEQERFFHK